MSQAEILSRLKVLFGIDAGDATHDAELMALFGVALAAARTYTHRWLYPVARFRESFQPLADCCRACGECTPVLVSEVPVPVIEDAQRDGATVDPATLIITAAGLIYEKHGALRFPLAPFAVFELTYQAGYTELPADLAEALCQVAVAAGGSSIAAAGGTAPDAAVKKLTVFDVGAVEYATAAGAYFAAELATLPGVPNALLGPWTTALDAYRDLAKSLGGDDCVHELENLGPIVAKAKDATKAATDAALSD